VSTLASDSDEREGTALLEVDGLSVEYSTESGPLRAVRDLSVSVGAGETFGIAGESGSGKSTLALAVMQYLGENGHIADGDVRFDGESLRSLSGQELQSVRGNRIAHVPQSPDRALNPSIEVGEQIAEAIRLHQNVSGREARERTHEVLADVNIPDPEYNAERYPHQLSGGMRQRVLIAMALSCNPDLLILDEPTTGLDVTTEAKILDLVADLKREYNASILLITHDLGVIAQVADRAAIMYAGEVMERGTVDRIFGAPANPYTKGLLDAVPEVGRDGDLDAIPGQPPDLQDLPDGCAFADRCAFADAACRSGTIAEESVDDGSGHATRCRRWETMREAVDGWDGTSSPDDTDERTVETDDGSGASSSRSATGAPLVEGKDVRKHFGEESFFDRIFGGDPPVKAVDGVDFEVNESETLGLVGESGCGKSTLAKTVIRLLDLTDGTVRFDGEDIASLEGADLKEFRSEAGIVFQHPDSSLNPRRTVHASVERPLKLFTDLSPEERRERVAELLEQVELGAEYADRHPHELSGGQKQRVAIARAFAANPSFVVLDEPLSALDVSVQASILNLLSTLRREYGSSFLFISHDLSVVNHISNRIAVMYLGKVVEVGSKEAVFEPPYHPYTQALLSSVPAPDPDVQPERIHLEGDVPSPRDAPTGCPFHTRCPKKIGERCEQETPELDPAEGTADGHRIACHLDEAELSMSVDEYREASE
jgi:peptide/nickel transport system ATP-binding protein